MNYVFSFMKKLEQVVYKIIFAVAIIMCIKDLVKVDVMKALRGKVLVPIQLEGYYECTLSENYEMG